MARKKKRRLNVKFLVALVCITGVVLVGLVVGLIWYKDSPERAIGRAQAYEAEGDWEEAAKQWDKAARADNGNPEYHLKAIDAVLHLTTEDAGQEWLSKAYGSYTAMLAARPGYMPALRGQLELMANSRGFVAAVPTYPTREVHRVSAEILKQDPNDARARTLHALSTINLAQFTGEGVTPQDLERAKADLLSVAQSEPGDGLAVVALTQRSLLEASQQAMRGEPEAGLEAWQQMLRTLDGIAQAHGALPETPTLQDARLQSRLGQSYLLLGRSKPAFDQAALVKAGQEASQIDTARLSQEPLTVETVEKGLAHLAAAVGALDDERDALDDDYYQVRIAYHEALLQQGKVQEAEQELRALAAVRLWDAQVSTQLAQFQMQRGDVEGALATLEAARAREQEPLPKLIGNAGVNARLAQLGVKPIQAELLLIQREMSRDPAQRQQLLTEAKKIFEEFEAQRKAAAYVVSPIAARVQGQIQMAEGDIGGAMQTLAEGLRLTENAQMPGDRQERVKALALLVDINQRRGQTGAQQRYMEEIVQLSGNPSFRRQLARLYLAQGLNDRAQAEVQKLLEAEPDNPENQQLAVQVTPPEQRRAAYQALPERTAVERRVKLNAAMQMQDVAEVTRLVDALRAELPPEEQRSTEQKQQADTLTLALAQTMHQAGQTQEAIALLRPLAERNQTVKVMLAQMEGRDWRELLPEGPQRLMAEGQKLEQQGDAAGALAKYEAAFQAAPQENNYGEALFTAYLGRGMFEQAGKLGETLGARNADSMNGRSYPARIAVARRDADAVDRATNLANEFPQLAEALALRAEALRLSGAAEDAVAGYRRALELAPQNIGALTGMVAALDAAGRAEEARPYIDTGLRLMPDNAFFRNADLQHQLQFGDPEQPLAVRRQAIEATPDNPQAHLELGQTLFLAASNARRAGNAEQANKYLAEATQVMQAAMARFPQDARFLQGLVSASVSAGAEAMTAVEPLVSKAISEGPLVGNPDAVGVSADFFARRGDMPRAEALVSGALANEALPREQRGRLALMLSQLIAGQNRPDEAVAVLSGFEDQPEVLRRKVEILATRVGEQPQDEELYKALREASDPPIADKSLRPGAVNAVAYAEIQRGNFPRALELLEQSRSMDANNPRTLFFMAAAEARRQGGSLDRAADMLEQVRRSSPGDGDALRELARVQLQRGRPDDAIAALARLSELNQKDIPVRLDMINLLLSLNPPRIAEAARQFRDAERAGVDKLPAMLMARARLELRREQADEAINFARSAYQEAAKVDQQQAGPYLNAYLVMLLEAGRNEVVLQETQPLVSAGTPPWWALRARGEALVKLGRRPEATAAYQQAFAAAEQAGGSADSVLVDMSRRLGFSTAYGLIKDRVEPTDGKQPEIRFLALASALHAGAGQYDDAIRLLEQARQNTGTLTPQQVVLLNNQLGAMYLQAVPRRLDEAESTFRRILETEPNHVGALNNLAYTLTLQGEQGRDEGSRAKLTEAVEIAQKAYQLVGREPSATITDTYGWAVAASGIASGDQAQMQEGARLLRQARSSAEASANKFPELYLHLSRVLVALGQGAEAQEAAEAGVALLDQMKKEQKTLDPLVESRMQEALEEARQAAAAGPNASAETSR